MKRWWAKKSVWIVLVLLVLGVNSALAWVMGLKPSLPAVREKVDAPSGYATTTMIVDLMQTQLKGFGGWLPNDMPPGPGSWLDNLPNFQLGVLQIVRHASRSLRDHLSRQRTSDAVHKRADLAFSAYANEAQRWIFPAAENAFQRGNRELEGFAEELGADAGFYPRADNLVYLLEPLISELGAVNNLLLRSASETSWWELDDNFYYAQGVGYATLGILQAAEVDFRGVLEDKNATEIYAQILATLEESDFNPWMVANGNKDGFLANHSNNLKVYLEDARQKLNSLVSILKQG